MLRSPDPAVRTRQLPATLIDKIYQSTLEPGRYDELMTLWSDHVERALANLPDHDDLPEAADDLRNDDLERHFLRAFMILERLGRPNDDLRSVEALIDVNPQPAMLASGDGRIIAANRPATDVFDVSAGDHVAGLDLDIEGAAQFKSALQGIANETPSRLLAIARAFAGRETYVLALTRAPRPDGAPPTALVTVADLSWTPRIGEILRRTFGLTEAECEVAKALVSGESPRQIAESRNRALLTVRTQTKAVLRKIEVRSQSELIRLTAALAQLDLVGGRSVRGFDTGAFTTMTMLRPGGRKLDVVTVGPEAGRPVLFIHGMLDGYGVTSRCLDELSGRNIRLIVPVRPNFGGSGADGGPRGAPERFCADLTAVMDTLGLERCAIAGHMAGSVYAFAAAANLGDRISAIVNVSGGVPIVSRDQFAVMTPRQRIVAYTARYTPSLLPLILRAGIALLDSGGDHAFMKALYDSAPVDYAVARQPEIFGILSDGYRFTVAQGHGAFEIDSYHVTRDWSAWMEASRQPVTLVHGRHDPVVRIETVRAFADRYPDRIRLVEVDDLGQLVFYARPTVVLDAVETALATAG